MATIDLEVGFHPRQMQAFLTDAQEILFGGASGGGKSHWLRHTLATYCLMIPGLQCSLIRKKNSDILSNHLEGSHGFRAILKRLIEAGRVRATQDGVRFIHPGKPDSLIEFIHCQDERQFDTAQGVERHVVAVDEATQISERLLRIFRLWCRMSKEFKATIPDPWRDKFPKLLYTANPIGASVGYFRRHFVLARPEFAIESVGGFRRQYIPSRILDNPSADLEAHQGRMREAGDKALAKALNDGDWNAPLGDFYPEWDEARHVVPDFIPPSWWLRYRSFDWGSADPFAVYWIAVSDGESFETEYFTYAEGAPKRVTGRLWFPRGAKVFYREWYGCQPDNPAKGIGLRNADIAKGIRERSPTPEERDLVTLTDSYVFPDRGEENGQTIAKTFKDNGVPLTLGDTSRITGWAAMRDALIGVRFDLHDEQRDPMMFVCESCKYLRDYIPALPRHPNEAKRHEDAAEHGEATHACDAARLAVMATGRPKDAPVPNTEAVAAHIARASAYQPTMGDAIKLLQQQKAKGNGRRF